MNLVNIKKNNLLKVDIIEIDKKKVEIETQKRINDISNNLNLKGFRSGKAPLTLINKRYKNQFRSEVISEFLNEEIKNYAIKNKTNFVSDPLVTLKDDNETIIFEIKYEVFPKITLNLDKIYVKKVSIEISENDIENEINHIREIYGDWSSIVDEKILEKDKITINISSSEKKNKIIKQSLNRDISIIIDNNNFVIENLKEKLKSCNKIGKYIFFIENTKIVEYETNEKLNIDIKKIERKKKADLNINLAKKLNIAGNDLSKIKNYAITKIEQNTKYITYSLFKNDILEQLIKVHEVDVPNSLFSEEIKKSEENKIEIDKKKILSEIKLKLILREIVSYYNINILEKEINNKLNSLYPNVDSKIRKNMFNSTVIDEIINFLTKKINIEEIKKTLNELVNEGIIK